MKLFIFALSALASFAGAGSASAQGKDQFAIGISAGGTVVTDGLKDHHTNGPAGMLSLAIGSIGTPVGFRLDFIYTALGDRKGGAFTQDQGKALVLGLAGNAIFSIYGQSTRLYAIAGAGGYGYRPKGAGTEDATDLGLNAGLGIWIPKVSGFIEARYHNVFRALPDSKDGEERRRSARFVPITFGVLF